VFLILLEGNALDESDLIKQFSELLAPFFFTGEILATSEIKNCANKVILEGFNYQNEGRGTKKVKIKRFL
jgi:hypothetical protein